MCFARTNDNTVGPVEHDDIAHLERIVQRRLNGRVRDLRVLVHSDGLILQGNVSTYYAKQLAQHAVMEASWLPILANDIEVCHVIEDSHQADLSWA